MWNWTTATLWCLFASITIERQLERTTETWNLVAEDWNGDLDSRPRLKLSREYSIDALKTLAREHNRGAVAKSDSADLSEYTQTKPLPITFTGLHNSADKDQDIPLKSVSTNLVLHSRQPDAGIATLVHELNVEYHFHCATLQPHHSRFRLRATSYGPTFRSYNVELEVRGNIGRVSGIRYERQHHFSVLPVNFFAKFEIHICYAFGTVLCSYSFTGHIEGVLSFGYLWFLVSTELHDQETRPIVTETCITIHGRGICPALSVHQHECYVHQVEVEHQMR